MICVCRVSQPVTCNLCHSSWSINASSAFATCSPDALHQRTLIDSIALGGLTSGGPVEGVHHLCPSPDFTRSKSFSYTERGAWDLCVSQFVPMQGFA
ncbi:hypothetical protein LshimejAT787_1301040 [Lyophyllum shimeji]|uniref:Uncharacterized protein n=1 Tax=Lyophyllum shimeji TaxID=47721 RepID=A0A9P3PX45_LYOSH|nr:hypothetical protein LshimejAT787_1301040 [Lyophyllum shimeji]